MEAEYEVQRTIKRAELTAFLCLLKKVIGPINVHVYNKGIIDGLRQGEKECIKPRAGDTDLWKKTWEEIHSPVDKCISVQVEHVKAHRTKKEKENMSLFEKFVTTRKAMRKQMTWQKEEQCWTKDSLQKVEQKTMQQEREEVYGTLHYAASSHCLVEEWKYCEELRPKPKEKWVFVEKKSRKTMHRTEWCAEANKNRCMRCGRGSKYVKKLRKMCKTTIPHKKLEKRRRRHLGGHDLVRRVDKQGEILIWCRKCSGYATQSVGPKLMNCCKPELMGTKKTWQNDEEHSSP